MTRSAASTPRHTGRVRCAIYTRKSSEEGLEQEFNSLQAQREACEAFINSQRHEGWVYLPACYDDGGFSGATMDRPALQPLLADITAGRVDTVGVYKSDRLTKPPRLPLAGREQPIVLGFALSRSELKAPPRSLTPKPPRRRRRA